MTRRGESKRNPVMLSTCATLSVNSAKHLDAHPDRPFAAAQGDTVRQLRLMRIGRPKGRPYYTRRDAAHRTPGCWEVSSDERSYIAHGLSARRTRRKAGYCSGWLRCSPLSGRGAGVVYLC